MLQLSGEVENAAQLQTAGDQMLKELSLSLRRHQAAVQEIRFSFHHLHHAETVMRVAALEPSCSPERFSRLLKSRLENAVLPAPVIALSLRSGRLQPLKAITGSLFKENGGSGTGSSFAELIECLRNRFGAEAVYGLCLVSEHRPESAWIKIDGELGRVNDAPQSAMNRPLWVLTEPVPLVMTSGGPCYEGVLSLEQGPERIETGWWDGRDVARDYFHARNPFGMNLWVYRQRRGHRGWYLHGIFG
jgi:protein ImuB